MWSDQYHYLNIYSDKELSASFNTQKLSQFLNTFSELEASGPFKYKNKSSFPFIEISLLKAKNIDSWSGQDADPENTNLITIVCSKGNEADFEKIKNLLNKITSYLGWQLVEEDSNGDTTDI